MRTEQVNLRLEEDMLEDLERVAKAEALDRSTVIRRLLRESVKRWQLEQALRGYERGDLSIGRAAEEAGLTQWGIMDVLRREGISYPMSADDVHERLRGLAGRAERSRPGVEGFRIEMEWLGSKVATLADVPPSPGRVLLVGINPAPISVAAGHYYQGRLGRRLWGRLGRLGLLAGPTPGAEDVAFVREGHGLTDIVKRPTTSAAEITETELRAGVELLREKVRAWGPALVLFSFKRAADAVLGSSVAARGLGPPFEGATTFVLSGPYSPTDEARKVDAKLLEVLHRDDETVARTAAKASGRASPDGNDKGARGSEGVLDLARERFGSEAVQRYLQSERQSEAARALGMPGVRLRNITRSLGTYVSRGDIWDKRAKLATLAKIVRPR